MLQSEQPLKRNSSIKDEIRSRKKQISDEQYGNNTSFRSYRKAKQQKSIHNLNNVLDRSNGLSAFTPQAQQIKLMREYPSYSITLDQKYNRIQPLKFNYQLQDVQPLNKHDQKSIAKDYIKQQSSAQSFVTKLEDKVLTNKVFNSTNKRLQLANRSNCRSQVKSIIFDSKVEQFQPFDSKFIQILQHSKVIKDREIQNFQEKVNKVNFQIEEGLSNLQKMIQTAKKKKIARSIVANQENISQREKQFYQNMISKKNERQKIMSQIVETHQAVKKESIIIQSKVKQNKTEQITTENKKQNKLEDHAKQIQSQVEKMADQAHLKASGHDLSIQKEKVPEVPLENQNQLLGKLLEQETHLLNTIQKAKNIKPQEIQQSFIIKPDPSLDDANPQKATFPPQYSSFINRLVSQIQLDIQFTTMISELSKSNHLSQIKNLIFTELQKYQNDIELIQNFFTIESSQIDPLQTKKPYFIIKYKQQQGRQQALKVYKKYKQTQKYFNTKLKNKYDISIIKILLQELSNFNFTKNNLQDTNSVTIGHLLSYLNMKTNKSLRNRYFVKMMKRLNLRNNQNLSIESLKLFIAQ